MMITNSPPPRLAVFDMDGTLIDSFGPIRRAITRACRVHELAPPTDEETRHVIGLSLETAIARLFPRADGGLIMRLAESYKAAYRDMRHEADFAEPLFPGARAVLEQLDAEGWLLGLATAKSRVGVDRTLAAHGLERVFQTIQTVDNNPGKPAPGMLFNALAETGAEAGNSIMIGDTVFDIEMAANAGIAALAVAWGAHDEAELRRTGAARLVTAFGQIPPALNDIFGGPGRAVTDVS